MIKIGSIIGDRAEIGCNAVLNPGIIIGHDTIIHPLTSVRGYVPSLVLVKHNGEKVVRS